MNWKLLWSALSQEKLENFFVMIAAFYSSCFPSSYSRFQSLRLPAVFINLHIYDPRKGCTLSFQGFNSFTLFADEDKFPTVIMHWICIYKCQKQERLLRFSIVSKKSLIWTFLKKMKFLLKSCHFGKPSRNETGIQECFNYIHNVNLPDLDAGRATLSAGPMIYLIAICKTELCVCPL